MKSGNFTLDNASSNTTMLHELEKALKARGVSWEAAESIIHCLSHNINLSSQRVIKSFMTMDEASANNSDDDEGADDEDEDGGEGEDEDEDEDSSEEDNIAGFSDRRARHNPLVIARKIVRKLRSSPSRRDKFDLTMRRCVEDGLIEKVLQPLLDVRTRWDSTYLMLNRLRLLRAVSSCFHCILLITQIVSHRLSTKSVGSFLSSVIINLRMISGNVSPTARWH